MMSTLAVGRGHIKADVVREVARVSKIHLSDPNADKGKGVKKTRIFCGHHI